MGAEESSGAGGVDLSVLARLRESLREHGDDVVQELLGVFENEGVKRLAAMDRALLSGDVSTVQLYAHTLRGSAQLIGAHRLAGLSARLEDAARDGEVEDLGVLFADLRDEYQAVARDLELERRGRA